MDFDLMISSFPKLLNATLITLKLVSLSLVFGIFLGTFFAILRTGKNKFLKIGRNDGFITSTDDLSTLSIKKNNLDRIFKSKKILLVIIGGLILFSSILLLI